MTSRINVFDTGLNRLIDDEPAPSGGVTHWNGFDGDVIGTLRNIFDFGKSDAPEDDNVFAQPNGKRYFNSIFRGDAFGTLGELFFEDFATQGDSRVGADIIVRSPGPVLSTSFHTDSVYLAGFGYLVPSAVEWIDRGMITADLDPTKQTGAEYWGSRHIVSYFFGNSPISLPAAPDEQKQVAYHADDLWFGGNFANGPRQARLISGWGQEFLYTRPQHNGVTPALLGIMTDADIPVDAAGDGTGIWFMSGDAAHEDNAHIRGMFNTHMTTADPNGPWQLDLWCFDGVAPYQIAKLDHLVGLGVFRGGMQLPDEDSTTFATSDAATAKIIWDPGVGKFMASIAGAPYVALSTVS